MDTSSSSLNKPQKDKPPNSAILVSLKIKCSSITFASETLEFHDSDLNKLFGNLFLTAKQKLNDFKMVIKNWNNHVFFKFKSFFRAHPCCQRINKSSEVFDSWSVVDKFVVFWEVFYDFSVVFWNYELVWNNIFFWKLKIKLWGKWPISCSLEFR